jgi:hypothetical protein
MCRPKSLGGLGILDLDEQNKCLLSKWIFKLANEDGVWQDILRKKYLVNKTLSQAQKKKGDSQFWSGLMEVKNILLERGKFEVHDGTQTRFWEDLWIGREPLMKSYPSLYSITRKKNVTVAQVLATTPLGITFRRAVVGENWNKWLRLVEGVMGVQLTKNRDRFIWTRGKTFSVQALYNDLVLEAGVPVDSSIWRVKIPLKIKIFLWYLRKGVVLTKDNLARRQWQGCTKCCFLVHRKLFNICFLTVLWHGWYGLL